MLGTIELVSCGRNIICNVLAAQSSSTLWPTLHAVTPVSEDSNMTRMRTMRHNDRLDKTDTEAFATDKLFGRRPASLAWRCFLACYFKRRSSPYLSDLRSPQFTERTRLTAPRRVRTARVSRRPSEGSPLGNPALPKRVHGTSHKYTRVKPSIFPVKILSGVTNVCDMSLYQFIDLH